MDNPKFADHVDISLIDEDDDYDDYSRYDTSDTSRNEETLFTQDTEQPVVRLRHKQGQTLLRDHLTNLYRYLDVDGNVDLVNTNLFKIEKSKSGAVELWFFNGENWVFLTNK